MAAKRNNTEQPVDPTIPLLAKIAELLHQKQYLENRCETLGVNLIIANRRLKELEKKEPEDKPADK